MAMLWGVLGTDVSERGSRHSESDEVTQHSQARLLGVPRIPFLCVVWLEVRSAYFSCDH